MPFLKLRGQKGSLQFKNHWNRAVQNMGQLCCHTKLPSASPGSMPVAIARAFDDQTLCPNERAVGFLSLQEILFGRKIGRLKKPKTGGCNMQSKIQIDQALPRPRQPRLSRPRQQQTESFPFARNFRCHPDAGAAVRGQINVCERFAALERGVYAAADAALLRSFSRLRRIEFLCRRFKQQNGRNKWLAQFKTLTLS